MTKVVKHNLYETIILCYGKEAVHLNIITGYCSPSFVEKVVSDLPHLSMDLYIGMSQEGIPRNSHDAYVKLTKNEKVNIFYQDKGYSPTHIKLLEFTYQKSSKVSFIGSSNFTENGFIHNRELMIITKEDVSSIFEEQKEYSLICTLPNIEEYVPIVINKVDFDVLTTNELDSGSSNELIVTEEFLKDFKVTMSLLKDSANWRWFDNIQINLVLPIEQDRYYKKSGLNAKFLDGQQAYIKEGNSRFRFSKFFPTDCEFTIYTDDGYKFQAQLRGNFSRELHFKDVDIHRYFLYRLKLKENTVITYHHLKEYGRTSVNFFKYKKNTFIMDFLLD